MKFLNFFKKKEKAKRAPPAPRTPRPLVGKPTPDFANPDRTILMFWPNSQSHGWADLLIRLDPAGSDETYDEAMFWEGYVSYIEQTFDQIVSALITLAEGGTTASAFANMEPTEAEFQFSRSDGNDDQITVHIREWSPYRDEGDHLVYDQSLAWTDFGTARPVALKHLMDDVLWLADEAEARFGPKGYSEAWGSLLPQGDLQRLRDLRAAMT